MGKFSKIKKYSKPSLEIDKKIRSLDQDLKKTLGEAIANSTSGLYSITGFEPGDPAIPEIPAVPAVPPTYEDVTGGLSNTDDFAWGDQGDGSDSDAPPNIPDSLYGTYNGEQVAALRTPEVDHGEGVTPFALAFHGRAISSQVIGFLSGSGFTGVVQSGVYTTPGPYTDLQRAYLDAWNNRGKSGIYQYSVTKTVYLWGQLDCLFGSCYDGSAYYPSNLTNTSTPKADRALYAYTIVIPTDASGNPLPNRIQTDPGSPEIPAVPGVPEGPPKPIVLSRNELGDPNYYPGDPSNFLMGILNLGKRGYDYIITQSMPFQLRPDGTSGYNKPGDTITDPASGRRFKLVPSGKYGGGYVWKLASGNSKNTQIAQGLPIEPAQQRKGTTGVGVPDTKNNFIGPLPYQKHTYPPEWTQWKNASTKNKKQTAMVAHYEPEGQIITEGWESPKHTNIEKDQRERWFNPNDIAPEYPKEPPAPMVGGYSSKSLLAPKPIDREPVIKIAKKDLVRNHKLTDTEIEDLMDTINRINAFLAAHPEELIHAQKRYPKHDPRLAELNWKMDQMLSASDEYIETHFPENKRLFNKVQQAVKRSIKLTDPKTYKDVKDPQTVYKLLSVDYVNQYERSKRKLKLQSRNKKTAARFLKKPRIKTRSELIDEKIIQLEKDMKKTGMGA